MIVVLAVEVVLYLCEGVYPKGWAVLLATTCVILTTLYVLFRFTHAFLDHSQFQFGIGSLLIFTVIIGGCCGWMKLNLNLAAIQKKALGPKGSGEGKWPELLSPPFNLQKLLGNDFFLDVSREYAFSYSDCDFNDSDYEFLKSVRSLKTLYLSNVTIVDSELARFKDFEDLTTLYIRDSKISETGLDHIGEMGNLINLDLYNIETNGDVAKPLIKLKNLQYLRIDRKMLSEEGLDNLKKMNQLKVFWY